MVGERRWILAALATCFIVVFSVEVPDEPIYSGCPLVAHSSQDLQNYLNPSIEPVCDTITLGTQEYTLVPFSLSGASTVRSIVGISQGGVYSYIKYNSSSDMSRVFDGAQLTLSKIVVTAAEQHLGGFLHVFGSGSQLTLNDVMVRSFRTTDGAVIEANEGTKIVIKRVTFMDNFCQLIPSSPTSCQRGVLYLGESRDAGEPSPSLVQFAELLHVIFKNFKGIIGSFQNTIFGGLVLSSSGTINVRTESISFTSNEGISLVAEGGATSKGKVYISSVGDSASWSFSSNTKAPACAILAHTESNISWSFSHNHVEEHAFVIENSVIRADTIELIQNEFEVTRSSRSASMAVKNSEIYTNSILMIGPGSEPTFMGGLSSRASTIVAKSISASFLDPGIHIFPVPQRSSILTVSDTIELKNNAGGMIVEFTTNSPKPVIINTGKFNVLSNGNWPDYSKGYTTTTGGISMINSQTGNFDSVKLLEINADSILFKDNKAVKGGAISYTVPFSLKSPSITFEGNMASVGGVYYSQDPSFSSFIPNELFQTSTAYSSNSAVQGCIIGFASSCAAPQSFGARFTNNKNESYPIPVPVKNDCSVSEQYCSIPPVQRCGEVPSFGLRYMWQFDSFCNLLYLGDIEIPTGTTIHKQFSVEGKLSFERPKSDLSTPTYSLIMQEPAMINAPNFPILLPRLPISYTVLTAPSRLVIFKATEILPSNTPRVDFFVTDANQGKQFVCHDAIVPPFGNQREFGFERCRLENKGPDSPSSNSPTSTNPTPGSHKSSNNKMIIIIASAIAAGIVVSVSAAVAIYCVVKKRATPVGQQYQPLPSDAEY